MIAHKVEGQEVHRHGMKIPLIFDRILCDVPCRSVAINNFKSIDIPYYRKLLLVLINVFESNAT